MMTSKLSIFIFATSIVFVGVFVSGCGGSIESNDMERYYGKNVFIVHNVSEEYILETHQLLLSKTIGAIKFTYKNETCQSIGFEKFVENHLSDLATSASLHARLYDEKKCNIEDGADSGAYGSSSAVFIHERLKTKKDIVKNASFTIMLTNINTEALDIATQGLDKNQKKSGFDRVHTFDYDNESCKSLGVDFFVAGSVTNGVNINLYIADNRRCITLDYSESNDSGNKGLILLYAK